RYMMDLRVFGVAVAAQWWRLKFRDGAWSSKFLGQQSPATHTRAARSAPDLSAETTPNSTPRQIEMPSRFDAEYVRKHGDLWQELASSGQHCLLDGSDVHFVDCAGLGVVI